MNIILHAVLLFVAASTAIPVDNEDTRLVTKLKPTTDRIREHGYPAEEHSVETTDGYVIRVFRIPYSHKLKNKDSVRPAVLLQHGLFSCSDIWIANGPENALPYLLADLGYDVWLGNSRGNIYGRRNTKMSPDNPKFWRFSWHEIGVYDVSAMIDYILSETNQKAVHYVGHSQGTSAFFVLMSMRPEYNQKIKTAHMLAPIGYMNHMTNLLVNFFAPHSGVEGVFSTLFGSAEFLPHNEVFILLAYNACGRDSQHPKLCSEMGMLYGGEEANTNMTAMSIVLETHPAGASTDQVLHYFQEFNSGHFRQFDFGTKKNIEQYNQPYPPDYEVENISSEVHLYYSDNDSFAAVEDVLRLATRMRTATLHHVLDTTFSHLDFAVASNVMEEVNRPVIDKMTNYENKNYINI